MRFSINISSHSHFLEMLRMLQGVTDATFWLLWPWYSLGMVVSFGHCTCNFSTGDALHTWCLIILIIQVVEELQGRYGRYTKSRNFQTQLPKISYSSNKDGTDPYSEQCKQCTLSKIFTLRHQLKSLYFLMQRQYTQLQATFSKMHNTGYILPKLV